MEFEIIVVPSFQKSLKKLAKKYLSLKNDLLELINSLEQNPYQGTSLGNNSYKYDYQLHRKIKVKAEELVLLR